MAKKTSDNKKKAEDFFLENPKCEQLFITGDGFMFLQQKFANDHAKTLGDEAPECFKNPSHLEDKLEEGEQDEE